MRILIKGFQMDYAKGYCKLDPHAFFYGIRLTCTHADVMVPYAYSVTSNNPDEIVLSVHYNDGTCGMFHTTINRKHFDSIEILN